MWEAHPRLCACSSRDNDDASQQQGKAKTKDDGKKSGREKEERGSRQKGGIERTRTHTGREREKTRGGLIATIKKRKGE